MGKEKIKVKIKDIHCDINPSSIFYSWRRLRKSINTNGYKPENFSYILVYKHDKKYHIINGNHRIKVLEQMYGEDYELEVICRDKPQTALKDLYTRMVEPVLGKNKSKITKIITLITLGVIFWYFFISNLLATIILSAIIWYTINYFPENTYSFPVNYEADPDKKKWQDKYPYIYTLWLNLYKNLMVIIIMTTILCYIIYLAYGGVLKLIGVLLLVGVAASLKEKEKNNED